VSPYPYVTLTQRSRRTDASAALTFLYSDSTWTPFQPPRLQLSRDEVEKAIAPNSAPFDSRLCADRCNTAVFSSQRPAYRPVGAAHPPQWLRRLHCTIIVPPNAIGLLAYFGSFREVGA